MDELRKQFSDAYSKASLTCQARFLAKLLSHLTMTARITYEVGQGVADSDLLRSFNEAHNRVTSQLSHLLEGEVKRYPDDVFANIIIDNLINVRFSEASIRKLLWDLMTSVGIDVQEPPTTMH